MPYNRNGGLTLVPMPGFVPLAQSVKGFIETRKEKKKKTKVDVVVPEFGERASGEPFVRLGKDHIGGHDCVVLTSGPGVYRMLIQLFFLLGHLVGRRAGRITLVTGILPLGRSDKDEGLQELALCKHVIHLIEASAYDRLDRIIAVDLHAPQAVMAPSRPGVLTEISLARRLLVRAMQEASRFADPVVLLFPDDGAARRFEWAVTQFCTDNDLELPTVHGIKRRKSSEKSKLLGLAGDTDQLRGATVIQLDDETATGGSNKHTAEAVKEQYGAKRCIAASVHGVLCGVAPLMLMAPDCPIDIVIETDTIPPGDRPELSDLMMSGRLIYYPWAEDLAHVIYHNHWDISVREMR